MPWQNSTERSILHPTAASKDHKLCTSSPLQLSLRNSSFRILGQTDICQTHYKTFIAMTQAGQYLE